jgi:hypothetical protein
MSYITLVNLNIYDNKEDISKSNFQDESLFRVMKSKCDVKCKNGFGTKPKGDNRKIIDRNNWKHIDKNLLESEYYITCNLLRPFNENYSKIKVIADFIAGYDTKKEDIVIHNDKKTNYLKHNR